MRPERLWAVAQEPVPAVVVGAWGLLGAVIAVFMLRFRGDWRAGVKAGAALVAASAALAILILHARGQSKAPPTAPSRSGGCALVAPSR